MRARAIVIGCSLGLTLWLLLAALVMLVVGRA